MGKGKRRAQERAAAQAALQALERPDVPLLDELRMETVEFKCWRCLRVDYREKNYAEAIQRNGKKLFCTPCDRPDLFEWKVERLEDGTKREYLRPLTYRETYNKISPEARLLAEKQGLVQTLRTRLANVTKLTAELEVEYLGLMEAIPVAEADMLEAERKVSALEHDQVRKKVETLTGLNAKVMQLVKEIDEAKRIKAEMREQDRTTGNQGGGDVAADAT